jgi:hypothetical protein
VAVAPDGMGGAAASAGNTDENSCTRASGGGGGEGHTMQGGRLGGHGNIGSFAKGRVARHTYMAARCRAVAQHTQGQ